MSGLLKRRKAHLFLVVRLTWGDGKKNFCEALSTRTQGREASKCPGFVLEWHLAQSYHHPEQVVQAQSELSEDVAGCYAKSYPSPYSGSLVQKARSIAQPAGGDTWMSTLR